MSNSNQMKTTLSSVSNCGQKKRKTNQMSFRPLDNSIIERIVSDLPLIRKLEMREVNKQFKTCIDQILAKEESIQFVNTYGKDVDIFVDNYNKNRIELSKIGHNFNDNNKYLVELLSKFGQIRRLEFENNITINNPMIEWILKRFPKLSSLSLMDYRCNYLTFDWMSIGDKLSQNLISLQIECRLNQQILDQNLADLVSKLDSLQELTICCPRRRLNKVFAAFGPNLVKLRITYCLGLYIEEIMALINGNGRQLQELDINYQTYGYKIDQNNEFALICAQLSNLKSFTFNHFTLSTEALAMVSNLQKLEKFQYNYYGYDPHRVSRFAMEVLSYGYKYFDFRSFTEILPSLNSLSLFNIELRPQMMFNWIKLFPKVENLYLKSVFLCGCQTKFNIKCSNCLGLCFNYLSQLKALRSIDFGDSLNLTNFQYLHVLQQINFLRINCFLLEDRNYLFNILALLTKMANYRKGRPLMVHLYNMRCGPISRFRRLVECPPNLKITFGLYSDN